ncbi:hypothetical protein [Jannaschia sp. M317]|nr:hypothetical protein [Jannaschia sp. M317]UWQ18480.1 hypothetical protein K3551_04050 [Jannaschia sp. M317]
MSKAVAHNIRLTALILALAAGVVVQKHAHGGQHADCTLCTEVNERG